MESGKPCTDADLRGLLFNLNTCSDRSALRTQISPKSERLR